MPGVDWIPGISQIKASLQVVSGDTEGAKRTMRNFVRECPGVSQVTSLVQVATGDVDGAVETQKQCLNNANKVVNGIPVIGHAKGVVHHMVGDDKGGNQAFKAATGSTFVIGKSVIAAVSGGPHAEKSDSGEKSEEKSEENSENEKSMNSPK